MNLSLLLVLFFVSAVTIFADRRRCTDKNGNLLPSATICEDEIDNCGDYFKANVTVKPASRCSHCNVMKFFILAQKCAKTCGICCERPEIARSCQDSLAECPERPEFCTDERMKATWRRTCPRTCNYCRPTLEPPISYTPTTPGITTVGTTTPSTTTSTTVAPTSSTVTALTLTSTSKPPTTSSKITTVRTRPTSRPILKTTKAECKDKEYCRKKALYGPWMMKNCLLTCGICPRSSPTCKDIKPQCASNQQYCDGFDQSTTTAAPPYRGRATVGRITARPTARPIPRPTPRATPRPIPRFTPRPTPRPANCVDTFQGKGNCAQFKRKGFCQSGNTASMKKYCARTCNMC
uniref:ShKT domain-containing protein n=1 Tax=Steinernema glaseri TaxID=37863 RepID=A0A1I8AB04_9BILA